MQLKCSVPSAVYLPYQTMWLRLFLSCVSSYAVRDLNVTTASIWSLEWSFKHSLILSLYCLSGGSSIYLFVPLIWVVLFLAFVFFLSILRATIVSLWADAWSVASLLCFSTLFPNLITLIFCFSSLGCFSSKASITRFYSNRVLVNAWSAQTNFFTFSCKTVTNCETRPWQHSSEMVTFETPPRSWQHSSQMVTFENPLWLLSAACMILKWKHHACVQDQLVKLLASLRAGSTC